MAKNGKKTRKMRCWSCGSLSVIRWGTQGGKYRFKCKQCGILFCRKKPELGARNRFVWFRRWIEGKQSFKQLVVQSGYSERTLKRYFYSYLRTYPVWQIKPSEKVNLLMDGTYFANKVCLVLYRDNNVKATQLYRLSDGEWEEEIREDLQNLISLGITIESVTCDGLSNLLKAVRKTCPGTIIQRCLAHIQREVLSWLTRNPQTAAGIELREIVRKLHLIDDKTKWGYWVVEMVNWHEKYQSFVNQKSYFPGSKRFWYTHKMIRRSFIHIKRAFPDMFRYLDNPSIPKTTNALESFFGHLKENISIHRGLSKEHYKNYIKWYLYFRSNEK